jgi:Mannosyl-glycoprotein endo-beta-N-acetylglucosaminidase
MRCRRAAAPAVILLAALAGACRPARPAPPSAVPTPPPPKITLSIMGPSRLSAKQMAAWFNGRQPRPPGRYAATVPVEKLIAIFIEEGAAERVRGDVAFVQSVVETGWFRFGGQVAGRMNNFGGIGATDASASPAVFPDARTGVRAQIQHLRAYADPQAHACSVPPLRFPCVDPRFSLVVPKGSAPNWNDLGNGRWAASSTYAAGILSLYSEALTFSGR